MESKETQCIITQIGHIENILRLDKASRKQVLYVKEPGRPHDKDPEKIGVDNFFMVELFNGKIDRFNLLQNFRAGQQVTLTVWINGKIRKTQRGDQYESYIVLGNISPGWPV